MRRGDIYDAQLSPTKGSEQVGRRPVIIVSRDAINKNSPIIFIVPVTNASNVKRQYPNNVVIKKGDGGLTADSVALGGQVRAISKKRLLRQRRALSDETMQKISQALRITLDL